MAFRYFFHSLLFLMLFSEALKAQTKCTAPGQTPSTAVVICGNQTIQQTFLNICWNGNVFVPRCTDSRTSYGDLNPFYYSFTCTKSGTLGFTITPIIITDNFNWQLFDITGHKPDDIYKDTSLIVTGNWSGSTGATGASATGVNFIQCYSDPFFTATSTFSKMPLLISGHQYLLMISQHDQFSNNGFTLTIQGGDAVLTDNLTPAIKYVTTDCSNRQWRVVLNKKINCASLATDGSDFKILPAPATITQATAPTCLPLSGSDTILLTFDKVIPAGNYTLQIKNGTDGNSLVDLCNNAMPLTQSAMVKVYNNGSSTLDSLIPPSCNSNQLQLFFRKNILCNTVAADGSDFLLTGASEMHITGATAQCLSGNNTAVIKLTLSNPLTIAGNYSIVLNEGTDGNTIIDECGYPIPAGSTLNFSVKDPVVAGFTNTIAEGCKEDSIRFTSLDNPPAESWKWYWGNTLFSETKDPLYISNDPGNKTITLIVSNGFCTDTFSSQLFLKEKVKADFSMPKTGCTNEVITFINNSKQATKWLWDFDDGTSSTEQQPAGKIFSPLTVNKNYQITLIASNNNCADTLSKAITIMANCSILIPNIFTPNGDGLNDYLYPLNLSNDYIFDFKVFDRYGKLLFQSNKNQIKWDGTYHGKKLPAGTYTWYLKYSHNAAGKSGQLKGTSLLIR